MLLAVLRILAAIVGSVALYALLFMYEDAQKKWQNRIESLCVRIDDAAKSTGSKTSAFWFQCSFSGSLDYQVSAVVNRVFDRVAALIY